jgi:lysophospholipase L1-like esterase
MTRFAGALLLVLVVCGACAAVVVCAACDNGGLPGFDRAGDASGTGAAEVDATLDSPPGDDAAAVDGGVVRGGPDAGTSSPSDAGAGADTAPAGGDGASAVEAGPEPPGIQYFGRWDFSDASNPSASWGAVYFKATFEGTSVAVRIDDADTFAIGNDYEFAVDGSMLTILSPGASGPYPLASGLPDGVHTLEVYRRTEGSYGKTVIGGLVLDPGKRVLSPPPRPSRRIEIVGDSISAGFGDEGHGGSDRHSQNGYMAFGPQLARLLDAEWSVIAHSGRGLYRDLGEQPPLLLPHMPDEFRLTHFLTTNQLPAADASDAFWDFGAWRPDVVVIVLGTNDFAQPGPFPADADFIGAYRRFLDFVRGVYPAATIFCVGTFIAENGFFGDQWKTANADICVAAAAQNAAGDARVHCVDPCAASPVGWLPDASDYIGDWTHPTVEGHAIIANQLRDAIAPVMGW